MFIGLTMVIGMPAMAIGHRMGDSRTVKRLLIAGLAVGTMMAGLSVTSELLVRRCLDAGNTGCLDYGAVGVQTLILIIYGVAALLVALRLLRD